MKNFFNNPISTGLITLGTLALLIISFTATSSHEKEEKADFSGTFLSVEEVASTFSWIKTGTMLPAKELTVKSEVKGQVGGFLVTQGQQVQGGQPVIQMNDVFYLYDQKVDDAKSTYDTAEFLYNEKVKDEEQQENLLKQEISTLANQLNTTENELFSLSEMTAEYQTTKQQQANTKNEDFIVRILEKGTELQQMNLREFSFGSEYQTTINSETQFFHSSEKERENIPALWVREKDYLSKIIDCCYLILAVDEDHTDAQTLLQQGQTLQQELQKMQTDFSPFFQEDFQSLNQQKIKDTTNKIQELEKELNNKNLELETLKINTQTELNDLFNTLERAKNEYNKAYAEANKLTARATQKGRIKNILVNIGDFVEVGNPLFTIDTSETSLVSVPLKFNEFLAISGIENVSFSDFDEQGNFINLTGTILSHSVNANEQGEYEVIIDLNKKMNEFTTVVYLSFPLHSDHYFLPEELFSSLSNQTGTIRIYTLEKEEKKSELLLGRTWNGYREVLTGLDENVLFKM